MTQNNSALSSKSKSFNEVAIFLLVIGLLNIGAGYGTQQWIQHKEKNFIKTTGKVIGNADITLGLRPSDYRTREQHIYQIEFTAKDRLFRFGDSYRSDGVDYFGAEKDGTVTVLYDPKNPAVAAEVYRPTGAMRYWYFFLCGGVAILASLSKPSASLK